ncbi:hypothetical protein [Sphingomicrobium marinum]|uniref:hypothetical protein n=1 Tax=Sphingomicrobium marinum TaxID=1227950 RepID=UPI002240107B|nr:hypothetical protein [Sphingomicrobium marinum]
MLGKPTILIAVASLFAATPAFAQSPAIQLDSDVELAQEILTKEGAQTQFVEPAKVVPGDKLRFTISYRNVGSDLVEDFVVTNPMPSAVMLAAEGAAEHEVSVDGGDSWGALADMMVTDAVSGKPRAAISADVTHVRWLLAKVQPGEVGQLQYYAIVR